LHSALFVEHKEHTRLIKDIVNESSHEHTKAVHVGTLFETTCQESQSDGGQIYGITERSNGYQLKCKIYIKSLLGRAYSLFMFWNYAENITTYILITSSHVKNDQGGFRNTCGEALNWK
jgi:hypothetical protein